MTLISDSSFMLLNYLQFLLPLQGRSRLGMDGWSEKKQVNLGLIHRHCHEIYFMLCRTTIATQKLRYPKIYDIS